MPRTTTSECASGRARLRCGNKLHVHLTHREGQTALGRLINFSNAQTIRKGHSCVPDGI